MKIMLRILQLSNENKKITVNNNILVFVKNKSKICNICELKHFGSIYGSGCESIDNEIEIV